MRWRALIASTWVVLLLGACAPSPPSTRPIASPSTGPPPSPRVGLTQAQAISIARQASGAPPGWGVLLVESDWQSEITYPVPPTPISTPPPTGSGYVWYVKIGFDDGPLDAQGVTVILDYFDGHVISSYTWIS